MSSIKSPTNKKPPEPSSKKYDYLEKKYGKEPKISPEELKQMRWNWH